MTRAIDVDARRYAWCRGQAMWRMGLPLVALVEDLRGAVDAGQEGLARHTARNIGLNCAVTLNLGMRFERPLPPPRMRASWALRGLGDHPLARICETLVRGSEERSPAELLADSERLVDGVREILGEVPDPLTPEGYFPALALAREWLKLADAVGEEGFLPKEWTQGG